MLYKASKQNSLTGKDWVVYKGRSLWRDDFNQEIWVATGNKLFENLGEPKPQVKGVFIGTGENDLVWDEKGR